MEEKRPVFYETAASNGTQEPPHREPSCARPSRSGSVTAASVATRLPRKGNCTENGSFGHFPIRFGAGYVRSTLITLTMHSSRAGLSILAGCDSQVGFPKWGVLKNVQMPNNREAEIVFLSRLRCKS